MASGKVGAEVELEIGTEVAALVPGEAVSELTVPPAQPAPNTRTAPSTPRPRIRIPGFYRWRG